MNTRVIALASMTLSLLLTFVSTPARAQQPIELEPFIGMKDQFEISLPARWHVLDQLEAVTGKRAKTGPTVIFSSEKIDGRALTSRDQQVLKQVLGQLAAVEVGRIPSFMLDRLPAKRGMSCAGFDDEARSALLTLMATTLCSDGDEQSGKSPTPYPLPLAVAKAFA